MKKIVFCEDDDLTQKLIRIILKDEPYELLFASNGLEGLSLIERERPAMVFTDLYMDGIGGVELCTTIRSEEKLMDIPVVLMTGAFLEEPAPNQQIGLGLFTSRLAKPFTPGELRTAIKKLFEAGESTPPAGPTIQPFSSGPLGAR